MSYTIPLDIIFFNSSFVAGEASIFGYMPSGVEFISINVLVKSSSEINPFLIIVFESVNFFIDSMKSINEESFSLFLPNIFTVFALFLRSATPIARAEPPVPKIVIDCLEISFLASLGIASQNPRTSVFSPSDFPSFLNVTVLTAPASFAVSLN